MNRTDATCHATCACSTATTTAIAEDAAATAPSEVTPGVTRRRVVATTVLGAVAATALAACGGDDEPATTATPSEGETGSSSAGGDPSATESAASGGDAIAKLADIPVGGAAAAETADGTKIIIVQPSAGEVVAFDARCPHQGCTVAPSGDKLACPCHGSTFKTSDGSLITGPATSGLTEVAVKVDGEDVVAG
jgi:cytochrome b6-f complex iron-sulfur subunit